MHIVQCLGLQVMCCFIMLNSDSSPEEVLDQAESSFSSSHPPPRKPLGTTKIKKRDSNQELLEYLKTADERFMVHAKELNTAILNKMDEATNSMLGLLGRMVSVMEEQQGNKPWTQDSFCTLYTFQSRHKAKIEPQVTLLIYIPGFFWNYCFVHLIQKNIY